MVSSILNNMRAHNCGNNEFVNTYGADMLLAILRRLSNDVDKLSQFVSNRAIIYFIETHGIPQSLEILHSMCNDV